MDKLNFVRDGESKLPPGFRFQPTDEEIVFQYLARKEFSHPLPASVIPEINTFSLNPWELPGDVEHDRYFFTNKQANYRNISRISKATHAGYWKATGSEKHIVYSKRVPIFGIKKTMVFYKGKHSHATRTDWVMHVYCIGLICNRACNNVQQIKNPQGCLVQIGNWVLCHVFKKKRNARGYEGDRFRGDDDIVEDGSDQEESSSSSSSVDSGSSDLTEVSSVSSKDADDDGDATSQNI